MKDVVGSPGFYTLLAFAIGAAIRGLKVLPIPKSALPWIALGLGFASGLVEGLASGEPWAVAALSGLKGLASGTGAVAGNETLPTLLRAMSPRAADVTFGVKAGPSSLPANVPTVSVPLSESTKDTVVTPRPPWPPVLMLCFASWLLWGCAAQQLDEAIGTLTTYVSIADPALRAAYRAELDACGVDVLCADKVDRKWSPIIDASQEVRKVWCAVKPEDCK